MTCSGYMLSIRKRYVVVVAGSALAAVVSTTSLAEQCTEALITTLERRFSRSIIEDGRQYTGVIALGGIDERIREAGRLSRRFPHLRILISGAGEPDQVHALLGGGIAESRVVVESLSKTTYENALAAFRLGGRVHSDRWLLVTSATHMPRAIGAFRSSGVVVEPWPVFDREEGQPASIRVVAREWIGLMYYRISGRSHELFPGPL